MRNTYVLIALLLLSLQLRAAIPSYSLYIYYPFTNGSTNDYSGDGFHAASFGATPATDRFGNVNRAYSFNGTSDYIGLPHPPLSFNFLPYADDADFTVTAWFKTNGPQENTTVGILSIASQDASPPVKGFQIILINNEVGLEFSDGTTSISGFTNGYSVADDKWHLVTLIVHRTAKTVMLYVDGNLANTTTNSLIGNSLNNSGDLLIGVERNGLYNFNGSIDDIRIYTQSVNYTEIQALYHENGYPLGWTQQNSGTSAILFSVSLGDNNNGGTVGIGGTALHTVNAGSSWTTQNSTVSSILFGISFPTANQGAIVGAFGTILHTTDGGANWTGQSSATSNALYGVHFKDANLGIAVGANGTIRQTFNGGTNWLTATTATSTALYGAFAADGSNLYAVGGGGTFVYTHDGGSNWTDVVISPSTLRGVVFVNANTGWAVGNDGTILRTSNGGSNWSVQTSGTFATLYSVDFSDANNGYVVGDSGIVLRTVNGGTNWIRQNSGTSNTLYGVSMSSSSRAWAVGDAGTILYTSTGGLNPPTFSSSATAIDFGLVPVSTTASRIDTVINYGEIPLNISLATSDNGEFSVFPSSASISPSTSKTFTISYSPISTGVKSGNIIFTSNAPSSPDAISVTGTGSDFDLKGTSYNDHNSNGKRDFNDEGLIGWKIYLKKISAITKRTSVVDSAITDAGGVFRFIGLTSGKYVIDENLLDGYVLTEPPSPGTHTVAFVSGYPQEGFDFGNTGIVQFTGPSGGLWSDNGNWSSGHLPNDSEAVRISVPVIYDISGSNNIGALECKNGASLTMDDGAGTLTVNGPVKIDNGGAINLSLTAGQSFICKGDWVNFGTFQAGNSTVVFSGNNPKSIDATTFWNVVILGDSTSTLDNVYIDHQIGLHKPLTMRSSDTVFIKSDSLDAIIFSGTGKFSNGSVNRKLKQGETGEYFFINPNSSLQFYATGIYPSSMTVGHTVTKSAPKSFSGLTWKKKRHTLLDTLNNFIIIDSVSEFSKWVIGTQGAGFHKTSADEESLGTPSVRSIYKIKPVGGNGFLTRVKLHFENSDIPDGGNKSNMYPMRGPFAVNTFNSRWNMISLPVTPENNAKTAIFPTSSSNAFSFGPSGYSSNTELEPVKGYWLKFPAVTPVSILGDDRDEDEVEVVAGWNMIGTPSYDVLVSSIQSDPSDLIASNFFGYQNGYAVADTLKPMQGYWVKVKGPGTLYLGSEDSAYSQKLSTPRKPLEKLNVLSVRDKSGAEQPLYFGANENINPVFSEMPPLPPKGIFDARFASERIVELADEKTVKNIPIVVTSATMPLTLTWDVKNNQGTFLLSVDGKERLLQGKGSVIISSSTTQISLKLSPVPQRNLPQKYVLEQNYPNPFNPNTVIKYQLPATSNVTLKIYNVLGQLIAALADEIQDAGYKSVEWDASRISSGVYFYRIEATSVTNSHVSFVQVRKMVLVK